MNRCGNLVTIGFANIAVLDEQVLGVLEEAVRILKAATQSFSSGVGSFCGYPSQAR